MLDWVNKFFKYMFPEVNHYRAK